MGQAMILYLCEKPSQARDIARVLGATAKRDGFIEGQGVRVTWCIGHLLEMVPPDDYRPEWKAWRLELLPLIPESWRLATRRGGGKQLKIIQGLLRGIHEVVLATDADREGETIGREVLTHCRYQGKVSRLWLSALDDASIRKALAALLPGERTEPLYQAGLGRARADWLVGMNLSRAYTLLGRRGGHDGVLTVGRVQTPTLKLVVERDRVIEQFQPVAYFEVTVLLAVEHGHFRAGWVPAPAVADEEGRCLDRNLAEAVAQKVQGERGEIIKAETKRVQEPPPLPLDLSTLQQEASRRWGMSAKRCLDTAQALYETHKAITYPRTDCRHLPESQFADAPAVLKALILSDPALAALVADADSSRRSRAWDDGKITAHHAMIPTGATVRLTAMSVDEMRLYDAIRRHYLAQFFPAFVYDRTVIESRVHQELFRATGRVEQDPGWKRVLRHEEKPVQEGDGDGEQTLPKVNTGEAVQVEQATVAEKRTKPPSRYTEGTLIQAMKNVGRFVENPRLKQILRETAGIGTEATRAAIIDNLLKRQFLILEGKKNLISTPAGRMLVDMLPHSVTDPATTAVWEQALEEIAQGKGSLAEFQEKAVTWVTRLVGNVRARSMGVSVLALPVGSASLSSLPTCLRCGSPMHHRQSVRGGFWGCSRYPRCRFTLSGEGPPLAGDGRGCPQCGVGQLVERTARQGRNVGNLFLGCNRFPECRYTRPVESPDAPDVA